MTEVSEPKAMVLPAKISLDDLAYHLAKSTAQEQVEFMLAYKICLGTVTAHAVADKIRPMMLAQGNPRLKKVLHSLLGFMLEPAVTPIGHKQ